MSLANSLGTRTKILTTNVIDIIQEPKELDDGARITDTIAYMGNATYPVDTTTQVISPTDVSFTPLFQDETTIRVTNGAININDLGLPDTTYYTPQGQSDTDFHTINVPLIGNATPIPVDYNGVYEFPHEPTPTGSGTASINFGGALFMPSFIFESEAEAQRVKYVRMFNGKYLKVSYVNTVSYQSHDAYIYEMLDDPIEEDYLRLVSLRDNINFQQLANVEYEIDVLSNSCDKFNIRFSTYDLSLNRVDAYDAFTYDVSNNPKHPPLLGSIYLKGSSVKYSKGAVYGFLEVQNVDGVGSLECAFRYGASMLQVGYNTSVEDSIEPPEEALNIFSVDYGQIVRDPSGVDRDLAQLEAQVAQNTTDIATNATSISSLQTGKFDKTGGAISSSIQVSGTVEASEELQAPILLIEDGTAQRILARIKDASTNQIQSTFGDFEILSGSEQTRQDIIMKANNLDLSANVFISGTNVLDAIQTNSTLIQDNSTAINTNTSAIAQKVNLNGSSVMTGALDMGTKRIRNLGTPTTTTDAATKQYVDNAVAGAGGGGSNLTKQLTIAIPLNGAALGGQVFTSKTFTEGVTQARVLESMNQSGWYSNPSGTASRRQLTASSNINPNSGMDFCITTPTNDATNPIFGLSILPDGVYTGLQKLYVAPASGQSSEIIGKGDLTITTGFQTAGSRKIVLNTDEVDAGSVQIKNLTNPTDAQDASTKNYTDQQITTATTNITNAYTSAIENHVYEKRLFGECDLLETSASVTVTSTSESSPTYVQTYRFNTVNDYLAQGQNFYIEASVPLMFNWGETTQYLNVNMEAYSGGSKVFTKPLIRELNQNVRQFFHLPIISGIIPATSGHTYEIKIACWYSGGTGANITSIRQDQYSSNSNTVDFNIVKVN